MTLIKQPGHGVIIVALDPDPLDEPELVRALMCDECLYHRWIFEKEDPSTNTYKAHSLCFISGYGASVPPTYVCRFSRKERSL